jgi:acyl-CoA thioester hydrolase
MSNQKLTPPTRSDFVAFEEIHSRWMDNDAYGHINNVVYYSFFDTAVNRYLIERNVLNVLKSEAIGFVIETQCKYFSPIAYPDLIHVGLKVIHLGNSSVKYEVAIFKNDDDIASAAGNFVHVYVNRSTNKPTPIPQNVREILAGLIL